jgi:GNAT superfamily N-acetyltransferase
MSGSEPTIELTDTPSDADAELLRLGLVAENRLFLGELDHRPLGLTARVDGRTVGGLIAESARGLLFIDLFWLAPGHRRRGLGSRLLHAAEEEGRRRGCRMAWLDTYDFQARPFYERHGYAVFGELAGLPGGHRRWFMSKRLNGSPGDP